MSDRETIFRVRNGRLVRFTAQVMNDLRYDEKTLAAAMIAEGLSGRPQGWAPPTDMPCYAWFEYCMEVTGCLTRGLRVLAGPQAVVERELAAEGGSFAGSMPGNF